MCSVASLVLAYAVKLPSFAVAAIMLGVVGDAEVDIISFLIRRYFGPAPFGRLYSVAFAAFLLGRVLCSSATATIASISTASDSSFVLRFHSSLRPWPWRCRDTKKRTHEHNILETNTMKIYALIARVVLGLIFFVFA